MYLHIDLFNQYCAILFHYFSLSLQQLPDSILPELDIILNDELVEVFFVQDFRELEFFPSKIVLSGSK